MRTFTLTISESENAVTAFKILREFDPALELGPTLALLSSAQPVITVETDCGDAVRLLNGILRLLDRLSDCDTSYSISLVEGGPSPIDGPKPDWTPTPATRSDLVTALDFEQSIDLSELPTRVTDLIESLSACEWFTAIGEPINDPHIVQGTLADAAHRSELFEYVLLDFQNALTSTLCYNFNYHYNRCWNKLGSMLEVPVRSLVKTKIIDSKLEIGQNLADRLRQIVQFACFECYFSDLVPPSRATTWIDWIRCGHLPYGWSAPIARPVDVDTAALLPKTDAGSPNNPFFAPYLTHQPDPLVSGGSLIVA